MLSRYFDVVDGTSAKFWRISVRGCEQTVEFGRIGSNGQTRTKTFADSDAAVHDALRQINKKIASGYKEQSR